MSQVIARNEARNENGRYYQMRFTDREEWEEPRNFLHWVGEVNHRLLSNGDTHLVLQIDGKAMMYCDTEQEVDGDLIRYVREDGFTCPHCKQVELAFRHD